MASSARHITASSIRQNCSARLKNNPIAQNRLAHIFASGQGTPADPVQDELELACQDRPQFAPRALGHAIEYAVLDRAGRLQLPREMTDALGMRDRVRLEGEVDHIGVWPDTGNSADPGAAGRNGTSGSTEGDDA